MEQKFYSNFIVLLLVYTFSLSFVVSIPIGGDDPSTPEDSSGSFFSSVLTGLKNVGSGIGGIFSGGDKGVVAPAVNEGQITKSSVEKAKESYNTLWVKEEYFKDEATSAGTKDDGDRALTAWVYSNQGAFTEAQILSFDTGRAWYGSNGRANGATIYSILVKNGAGAKGGLFDFGSSKSTDGKSGESNVPWYLRAYYSIRNFGNNVFYGFFVGAFLYLFIKIVGLIFYVLSGFKANFWHKGSLSKWVKRSSFIGLSVTLGVLWILLFLLVPLVIPGISWFVFICLAVWILEFGLTFLPKSKKKAPNIFLLFIGSFIIPIFLVKMANLSNWFVAILQALFIIILAGICSFFNEGEEDLKSTAREGREAGRKSAAATAGVVGFDEERVKVLEEANRK